MFHQPCFVSIDPQRLRIRKYIGRVKVNEADVDIIPDAAFVEELRQQPWSKLAEDRPPEPQRVA